jgi:hypothetical protein
MKSKSSVKLYNLIFPIWLLWLIPLTWFVVLPANFLVDTLVVILTMKALKMSNIKVYYKKVIWKVWGFGFLADFIGTIAMFVPNLIDFDYNGDLGRWWYDNLSNPVSYHPYTSVYAVLWISLCVLLTAFLIYLFNYKISFRKLDMEDQYKQKIALSIAIFTAPYLFFLPTNWFY